MSAPTGNVSTEGNLPSPNASRLKIGDVLPNGATVMEFTERVILARAMRGPGAEYITWKWDGEDPKSTNYGNYWYSLANAAKDFEERVDDASR